MIAQMPFLVLASLTVCRYLFVLNKHVFKNALYPSLLDDILCLPYLSLKYFAHVLKAFSLARDQ
jgi:hypothetical protein